MPDNNSQKNNVDDTFLENVDKAFQENHDFFNDCFTKETPELKEFMNGIGEIAQKGVDTTLNALKNKDENKPSQ